MADFLRTDIDFDYEEYGHEWEEKIKELEFLCSTLEGSCPGDRNFGLSPDVMAVTEKMEIYVPSLELVDVSFYTTEDGISYATLYIEPSEEEGEEED